MTTAAQSFPYTSSRTPGAFAERITGRIGGPVALALGFFCFMPYPSISIGNASAIQIGNVLTLVALVLCGSAAYARLKYGYLALLMLMPLVLCGVKVAVADAGNLDVCLKFIIVCLITFPSMVAVQLYAPRYGLQLLVGISIAALVHTAVGFFQLYSFSNGEFPLVDLYVNQSFTSVAENASLIAHYIQRPFGIFPEPSAMSSSLAPFVLLWVAELCGMVRFRQEPARWQRILFACAAAGGTALIIVSQSGHTMATLIAMMLFGLIWLYRAKATRRTFGVVATVFGLLLPMLLWWGFTMMSSRIGGEMHTPGGSWDERSSSLVVGFSLWAQGDLSTILFGLGPGLTPIKIMRAAGLDAVASVLLTYVYETGILGVLVVFCLGATLLRVWRQTGKNVAFAVIALVWVFGVTFITSYGQLLPIWIALGWLIVWPSVCLPGTERNVTSPDVPAPRPGLWPDFRPLRWTVSKSTETQSNPDFAG